MNIRPHLPLLKAPDSVWEAIVSRLHENSSDAIQLRAMPPRHRSWPPILAAAASLMLVAGISFWFATRRANWIETTASRGTTLQIGGIGSVSVGPRTRLRVVEDRVDRHRLELAHGSIYAKITAPPRLFLVDTKSGTAIDLGCEYAMTMNEDGSGTLHVSAGWVDFDSKGHESLVPAGAMCRIRPRTGPDIPYFEDASIAFGDAVERNDIDFILRTARARDTLTLWHLLSRVPPADRARVYDRIAALTPLPADLSRDRALSLDPETLKRLKDELAWKW
jgi:hypothetical protein